MITPELVSFIRTQRTAGVLREQISATLMRSGGWRQVDIDEAFGILAREQQPPQQKPQAQEQSPSPALSVSTPRVHPTKKFHVSKTLSLVATLVIAGVGGWYILSSPLPQKVAVEDSSTTPPGAFPVNENQTPWPTLNTHNFIPGPQPLPHGATTWHGSVPAYTPPVTTPTPPPVPTPPTTTTTGTTGTTGTGGGTTHSDGGGGGGGNPLPTHPAGTVISDSLEIAYPENYVAYDYDYAVEHDGALTVPLASGASVRKAVISFPDGVFGILVDAKSTTPTECFKRTATDISDVVLSASTASKAQIGWWYAKYTDFSHDQENFMYSRCTVINSQVVLLSNEHIGDTDAPQIDTDTEAKFEQLIATIIVH